MRRLHARALAVCRFELMLPASNSSVWWSSQPRGRMGATLMQTIAFAAAAYVYSKPEVYTNAWAWALLPTVVYLVYSFLDGSELTPQVNVVTYILPRLTSHTGSEAPWPLTNPRCGGGLGCRGDTGQRSRKAPSP